MKTLLLSITTFLVTITFSYSQCNPLIYPSPGCTQVTASGSITITSGGCYWICAGLTVNILASPGSAYYCEQNVTLNIIDSDGDQVYAKPGCSINNLSAQDIGLCADPLTITQSNTGGGTLTLNCTCSPLTYDYSFVGSGSPCKDVLGIEEKEFSEIKIYPTIIRSGEIIQIESGNEIIESIKIMDITGQTIQTINGNVKAISTSTLVNGNYFVVVSTSGIVQTSKIVVL